MTAVKSILGVLLVCLLTFQQADAANKDEQINSILEQTGFDKLLQFIPNFAQAKLKQSSGALEPEVNSALSAAFSQAFATATIQRDVIDIINTHYDEARATLYLRQLNMPIAKKMEELVRDTNNPSNREDMMAFATALQNKPASDSRTALIERLDKANRMSDFKIDIETAFFKAIFVAVDPVMEADMRLGDGELDRMVNEVRTSIEDAVRSETRLSYLYAFRNISDDELTQYIELCESEEYRWAIQLLGNAMISALNQAADRAATAMAIASSH